MVGKRTVQHEYAAERILLPAGTGIYRGHIVFSKKQIHFINIPTLAAYKPLEHFEAEWVKASPENVAECTAVGWFFADFLQRNMDVPVGIINASYGGSNIEAWMNAEACKQFDDIPVPPLSDETSPWISNVPTVLYNGMIHPLVGYGIKVLSGIRVSLIFSMCPVMLPRLLPW